MVAQIKTNHNIFGHKFLAKSLSSLLFPAVYPELYIQGYQSSAEYDQLPGAHPGTKGHIHSTSFPDTLPRQTEKIR